MSSNATVLVVDDERAIADVVSLRLRAAGYETLIAGDGAKGVSMAIESVPDVIVLDVRMPRQDGLSALSELRKHCKTKDIPVVMLSASLHDQPASLDAGARFFLTKPYDHTKLLAAIEEVIAEGSEAAGGEQAIELAARHRPDAIALDIRMPSMDGLTTLERLRQARATAHIPDSMMSASLTDKDTALDRGAQYFVAKLYEANTLIEAIKSLLSNSTCGKGEQACP